MPVRDRVGALASRRPVGPARPLQETKLPRITRRHALEVYQPIVDLANGSVDADNHLDLAVLVLPLAVRVGIMVELSAAARPSDEAPWGQQPGEIIPYIFPYELKAKDIRCHSQHEHGWECFRSAIRRSLVLGGPPLHCRTTSSGLAPLDTCATWIGV